MAFRLLAHARDTLRRVRIVVTQHGIAIAIKVRGLIVLITARRHQP